MGQISRINPIHVMGRDCPVMSLNRQLRLVCASFGDFCHQSGNCCNLQTMWSTPDLLGGQLEITRKSSLYRHKRKTQGICWEILIRTLFLKVALSKIPAYVTGIVFKQFEPIAQPFIIIRQSVSTSPSWPTIRLPHGFGFWFEPYETLFHEDCFGRCCIQKSIPPQTCCYRHPERPCEQSFFQIPTRVWNLRFPCF